MKVFIFNFAVQNINNMKKSAVFLMFFIGISGMIFAKNGIKTYELKSPDQVISVSISVGDEVQYSVRHGET